MSIIAVDFDGTLCEEKWPEIGKPNWPLIMALRGWRAAGHKLILWTCRCDELLDAAVKWCKTMGLEFDAVNDNLPENIEKYGNNCRKVWADCYIDDKNACPNDELTSPIYLKSAGKSGPVRWEDFCDHQGIEPLQEG